jgi:hypothetical protein
MGPTDFLDRYQRGEQVEVWAELVAVGAAVREPPLDQAAIAVATAMMRRVRHNLALLITRLHMLNYRFASPQLQHIWRQPDPSLWDAIHD